MKAIKELCVFREMLFSLVKRDIRSKYKGSFLGYLWTLLNPVLQLLVYTLVFGTIFGSDIENFPLFLFVGLVPWNSFSTSINAATPIVVDNAGMIKKIYFPKLVLPVKAVLSNAVDQLFASVIILACCLFFGYHIGLNVLWFPIVLLLQIVLTIGLSSLLSALYTKFRDLAYIVNFVTMLWFYLTPILYSGESFSGLARVVIMLNPMTAVIVDYRNILLYNHAPSLLSMLYLTFVAFACLVIGVSIFKKMERNFAEEI